MPLPRRIILIRHAQSAGNIDHTVYAKVPDHKIVLTPLGHRQAIEAGIRLRKIIGRAPVEVYLSSFARAQETFDGIRQCIKGNRMRRRDDPRLGEQEWGILAPSECRKLWRQQHKEYGPFYFRVPQGESGSDVYTRVSGVLDSLWRDFKKKDFAENVVVVSHGLTIRLFLMRWFHLPYQVFDRMENPENGQMIVMTRVGESRHFKVEGLPVLGLQKSDFKPTRWATA
jgi:broad specificity phosphatase PhoE